MASGPLAAAAPPSSLCRQRDLDRGGSGGRFRRRPPAWSATHAGRERLHLWPPLLRPPLQR
jgi:hypothetical protein